MKKLLSSLSLLLTVALLLTACAGVGEAKTEDTTSDASSVTVPTSNDDMFSNRDTSHEYDDGVTIKLNGTDASCTSDAVKTDGGKITLLDGGTYIFSGELSDGMIIVNADDSDKVQIVLKNARITSATSAAIYVYECDKVFVTLEGENTLSNGGSFVDIDDSNIDATVFSKQDLTFNGDGSLTVSSPAGHGIVGKDDLVFTNGTYAITSASHGIDANDSVRITDASFEIRSGKDGIHSENSDDAVLGFVYIASGDFNISSAGDGISAGSYMNIEGGSFDIISGGGSANAEKQTSSGFGGMGGFGGGRPGQSGSQSSTSEDSTSNKGIKSTGDMLISGGTFKIDSADDAVHSNASIEICGGMFDISTGDDGFHADETLTVSSGTISITESYEGLEGLHVKISGGVITLVANDDGINAAGGTDSSGMGGFRGGDKFGGGMGGMSSGNGSIVISGGTLYIEASGDGIDANGTLEISGGHTTVCGPTQGDTATLDYDKSATISGGTFIGTGASGMAQTFSDSKQGVIAVRVGNQSAKTEITLTDADGNIILSYSPALSFAVVILSSPDMIKGEEYTITVGSNSSSFAAE